MSSGEDTEGAAGKDGLRRCAACNYLRRRCTGDCVLAPHFPASDPELYAYVQRFFGAGTVARMLQVNSSLIKIPIRVLIESALQAYGSHCTARWRAQDPVYGCAGVIDRLQEEICAVQCELARTRAQIALHAQAANHHRHLQRQLQQDHQQQMPFDHDDHELDALLSDF